MNKLIIHKLKNNLVSTLLTKLMIITIIGLLLISSVTAITQTELETYSNDNIKNFLIGNLIHKGTSHEYENYYHFYYVTKAIKKNYQLSYTIYNKYITLKLPKTDWTTCRNEKFNNCINEGYIETTCQTYSYNTCKEELITNLGTYGDTTVTHEYGETETIIGNLYMVTSDRPFAVPVRVLEFEKLVKDKVYK